MKNSRLVQAITFSTLLSLSSACSMNQPRQYEAYYNYKPNLVAPEQVQKENLSKEQQKEKPGFRKFAEGTLYWTLQGLATAQYFIL